MCFVEKHTPFTFLNSLSTFQEIDHQIPDSARRDELLCFLNQQLRPTVSFSIQDEYPSVFKNNPGGKSLFFTHQGKPISHVAFTSRVYQHPLFELKVGLLGSVATQEAYRRKGLATQLVQEACERLKQEGCAFAVLWSDQPDFYRPLGFHRAGLELDFCLSPQSVLFPQRKARAFNSEEDLAAIFKIYQSQEGKIARSLKEMELLLQIPELKVFVTEDSGAIDSYIAINKGLDFSLTVHEWGGNLPAVMENVSYCQKNIFPKSPLNLIAPSTKQNREFSKIAHSWMYGSLGLVKLLDSKKLIETWQSYLNARSQKREQHFLENEESLLVACLGRDGQNTLQALPFFLWGFDSI